MGEETQKTLPGSGQGSTAGPPYQRCTHGILSYREDLAKHRAADPLPVLKRQLQRHGITQEQMPEMEKEAAYVAEQISKSNAAPNPNLNCNENIFVPTTV